VLGVPLGAQIGAFAGWRWAFGVMALFSGLVLALHLAVIPALPAASSVNLHQFGKQLRNRQLQAGLLLTLLLVTSHFMAFTFVRPLLLSVSGFDTQWLGALLFSYGFAGIIGNFLTGIVTVRHTAPTINIISGALLLTPLLFLAVGDSSVGGGLVLLAWGLAYGGVSVGLMTLMMKAAPRAVEIVAALYVGVFNVGIALGAWIGGQAVDRLGLSANLWIAAGFATAALLLSFSISFIEHRMKAVDKQLSSATD
jgi:predicted MFS family arabinose efflux permease